MTAGKAKAALPRKQSAFANGLNFWAGRRKANDGFRPKNYVSYCITPAS